MHSDPGHSHSHVEILDCVVLFAKRAGRDPYDVVRDYRLGVTTDDVYTSSAYSLLALLPDDHPVFWPSAPGERYTTRVAHGSKG